MDLRQSQNWGSFLATLGWYSCEFAARVRPLLFFSIVKVQRPEFLDEEMLKGILAMAKKKRAFLVKIEPPADFIDLSLLKKYRFHRDNWPLLPPKTIVVNLSSSEEAVLAGFSKDGRYCLRKAQNNRLEVKITQDTSSFYDLFVATSRRGHFWAPPVTEIENKINSFGDNAFIFMAYHENQALAGALVLIFDKTAYYTHAGSTLEGQSLEAPYLIIWEIIKKAKELGCTKLDLEGIYDPRFSASTKNWQGFTTFKKKFGGEEATYPGAFSRYLLPI